jgi:hypothetical protein
MGENDMKKLTVEERLEYARAGAGVIRALQLKNEKISYAQFAREIDLLSGSEKWTAWHRSRTGETLNLMSAAERMANPLKGHELKFDCIVDAKSSSPGPGFKREARIVRSRV